MHTEEHNNDELLISRRRWLQGTLALMVSCLAGSTALQALAAAPSNDALNTFMTLSQALTAPHALSPAVGKRLYEALATSTPNFAALLAPLAQALTSGTLSPQQESLALSILQAWYLGTVNNQVISYEHALMFAASKDVLIVRSYCSDKPGFWATKPGEA